MGIKWIAISTPFDRPFLIFSGLEIWFLAFPTSTILVGIFFKKAQNRKIV